MNNQSEITDANDPRILPEDFDFVNLLTWYKPSERVVAVSNFRRKAICRAAGIMGNDPGNLESLVWHYRGGENHGYNPETWKDTAEELKKELDQYLEQEDSVCEFLKELSGADSCGGNPIGSLIAICRAFKDRLDAAEARENELLELERVNLESARIVAEEREKNVASS